MESEFLSLRPLEQVILWRLLEQGSRYRAYDAEALSFYRKGVVDIGGYSGKVTAKTAQSSLAFMRDRTPALVWRSARGEYAVDDAMMHRWYEKRVAAGLWPPKSTA